MSGTFSETAEPGDGRRGRRPARPSAAPAIPRCFCRISLTLAGQGVICITWDIFPLTNFPHSFIIYAISDKAICRPAGVRPGAADKRNVRWTRVTDMPHHSSIPYSSIPPSDSHDRDCFPRLRGGRLCCTARNDRSGSRAGETSAQNKANLPRAKSAPTSLWKRSYGGFLSKRAITKQTQFPRAGVSANAGSGQREAGVRARSWATSANFSTAKSRSSRVWAAETCVRMRALPSGTTG